VCRQAYFWTYDTAAGECVLRVETTLAGSEGGSLLWSVWSWVSELAVFLAVPLVILIFNVLVIRELRALDRHCPPLSDVRHAASQPPPPPASGKQQVRSERFYYVFTTTTTLQPFNGLFFRTTWVSRYQ